MKSNHTPDIRFSGFTGDWEERKLGEITEELYNGQTPSRNNDTFWNGNINWLSSGELNRSIVKSTIEKITVLGMENAHLKIVPKGTFVMAITGLEAAGTRGNCGILDIETTLNQSCMAIFPDENYLNTKFLFQWYRKNSELYGLKYTQGTKQQSYNAEIVKELEISLPNIEEQAKIGLFFKNLDDLITLHQQELTTLNQTKKGFLQKMFPKEGESVPEVRFPGFTGDWKERKFKDDIVSIQTGTNLLGSESNSGTPLIKMGNIQRGYFSLDKIEYLDDNETVSELDIINNGDFLFNTRNTLELVGKGATWFCEGGKYAFNSNIARFTFKNINTYFFNYLYNTEQIIRQVRARAVGTTSVAAVYPRDLNSMKYMVPSIEEQSEIGNFFRQLDYTITLHQRELDALKETKIAFLQKMFA